MDDERLIECVRSHEALYNFAHAKYLDTKYKKFLWKKIAGELSLPESVEANTYKQISQSNEVSIEMDLLQVGSEPVGMRCPYCQEDVMTKANYRNTTLTHIIALVLGILFWWLCCCIIPYVVKKWKNVEHYCPNCRRFLGVYTNNKIF